MNDHDNDEKKTERLALRLPIGLKQEWKEKAQRRNFGAPWKYIQYLIDNDINDNELPPKSVELLEKLNAENQFLREKMELLVEKISALQELLTTKTLIQKIISEAETQKILKFTRAGKKLSEIALYLEKEEIITLGILDTLEGMGKIHYKTDNGEWITNERK